MRRSRACLAAALLLGTATGCTGIGSHPSQEELKRACDTLPPIHARRADLKGILRPDEGEFRILHGEAFTARRRIPLSVGTELIERLPEKVTLGRWAYDQQTERRYFHDPHTKSGPKDPSSTPIGNTGNLYFHYWSISATLSLSCWEYFPIKVIVQ